MFEHHKLPQSKNNRAIWLNWAPLSYSECVHEGLNEHLLGGGLENVVQSLGHHSIEL